MNRCYVCLKWGTKYSAEYVNKLASMVQRWDHNNIPFYCYTDDPVGLDSSINIIPLSGDYESWWFKLPLLIEPTIQHYDVKILFDLDVIIHNDISTLYQHASDNLTVCRSLWKDPSILVFKEEKNTLYNSSIMIWKDATYVWEHFSKDPEKYMAIYKGIDRFMWHEQLKIDTLPENIVYSYNKGATLIDNVPHTFRPTHTVCLFHQYPKQDTVEQAWVKEMWK